VNVGRRAVCKEDEMRTVDVAIACAAATAFSIALAYGAEARDQGREAAPPGPQYDPKAEVTIAAAVTSVTRIQNPGGQGGVHLVVQADSKPFEVHLGPEWFLTQRKYDFAIGEKLSVTGATIKIDGKDAILARQIKKGDQTMTFRDEKGVPQWAGRGRGRGQP
jgi:hypothetical protein